MPPAPSRAGSLPLVGGRLCLDYANTTSGRAGPRCQEHLRHYSHLIAWGRHSGLLGDEEAARLSVAAQANPGLAEAALAEAIALREAIHGVLLAVARGEAPDLNALGGLNRVLAEGMGRARLIASGEGYSWGWEASRSERPPLSAPLWPIARSAAELLTSPWSTRVRECPGEHCGWLFLDLTKNRSRRWCEMEVCGSRAKMQRYRERRRDRSAG